MPINVYKNELKYNHELKKNAKVIIGKYFQTNRQFHIIIIVYKLEQQLKKKADQICLFLQETGKIRGINILIIMFIFWYLFSFLIFGAKPF